jgi:hypothetical protein
VNATLLSTLNVELLAEVIADPDNQRDACSKTFSTASTQFGYCFRCCSAAIESTTFQIFLNYLSTQSW